MINSLSTISRIFFIALVVHLFATISVADLTIDGYTDANNDRFTNDPALLISNATYPGGLSGVGRGSGWATLISPNVVITAAHPPRDLPFTFYLNNDPLTAVTRNFSNAIRIGGSDLTLLTLDAPVSSSFQIYDFAREDLEQPVSGVYTAGIYQNSTAFITGISPKPNADRLLRQAVGQNVISNYLEDVEDFINAAVYTDVDMLFLAYNGPDGSIPFETLVGGGDSGAPLFFDEGSGNLRLLGVNSGVVTLDIEGGGTITGSGISYIGNHAAFIDSYIAANAVPEPSGLMLIGWAAVGLLLGHRRRYSV